ncbi:MAG TPA: hypothetical protein VFB39_11955 [Solirubrobacteraceae bacterium]|nr:hypothetical protein [Solirubrobacteraceae bacterium]
MITSGRHVIGAVSAAAAVTVAGLLATSVSAAQANVVGPTHSGVLKACHPSALSRPFRRWWDFSRYELAPGGSFEHSRWTLTGGAKRVAGSEPYAVTGTRGSSSLSLPRASSAQSPRTCVDATYPSIRFFIAGRGLVVVSLVDRGTVIPAGVVLAGGKWAPTPVMVTLSPVLGVLSGGTARVSVRFTGFSGNPRIDDVFIDPWGHG